MLYFLDLKEFPVAEMTFKGWSRSYGNAATVFDRLQVTFHYYNKVAMITHSLATGQICDVLYKVPSREIIRTCQVMGLLIG